MDTKEALLRQIDAAPTDLGLRCIYADWLVENGTSEAEQATAEWIMLTCAYGNLTKTGRPKQKAFVWLHANWERMVATARAKHVPAKTQIRYDINDYEASMKNMEQWRLAEIEDNRGPSPAGFQINLWRSARHLVTHWNLYPSPEADRTYSYRVNLHFDNGFLGQFHAANPTAQRMLNSLVLLDQPLCRVTGAVPGISCPQCGLDMVYDEIYRHCVQCGKFDRFKRIIQPTLTSSADAGRSSECSSRG